MRGRFARFRRGVGPRRRGRRRYCVQEVLVGVRGVKCGHNFATRKEVKRRGMFVSASGSRIEGDEALQ